MHKKLHIITVGSGNPLVLLHGWGWHSAIWKSIISQLSKNFQVFLIDLPGFGESTTIQPYSVDNIAQELISAVPPHSQWVGWSLGGMIAWWIAIHFPEKVSRLITIATSPKFISDENWPGVTPETLDQFSKRLLTNYHDTLRDFADLQLRGSPNQAVLLSELQNDFFSPLDIANKPICLDGLLGGLELLKTLDLRPNLKNLNCPSVHLFGSNDVLVPKEVATLIQPLLPHGRCEIIKRAGHIPFLTHPELLLNQLLF